MKAFAQQDFRKRLIVSMQMVSVVIATQCLKQWVVSINTVLVKRHELPSLKKTLKVKQKRGNWMKCGDSISRRKVTLLSNSGNVKSGNSTILMCK